MSEALDRIVGTREPDSMITPPSVSEPPKMTLAERLEQHIGTNIEFVYGESHNTVTRRTRRRRNRSRRHPQRRVRHHALRSLHRHQAIPHPTLTSSSFLLPSLFLEGFPLMSSDSSSSPERTGDTPNEDDGPEVLTDVRYVRDVIDGETVLSLREVIYALPDPGYPDIIDVLEVGEEPISLTGGSIQEISRIIDLAGLARFKPVVSGITAWRLEHRDGSHGLLFNVHDEKQCAGEYCTIHNRSDHHMRAFPQTWRSDAGFTERICTHGMGHPDPDELPYNRSRVHGCCGCCAPPVDLDTTSSTAPTTEEN